MRALQRWIFLAFAFFAGAFAKSAEAFFVTDHWKGLQSG